MRISVHLNLPREVGSVPAVRRLLRCALATFQVDREAGDDLEIALTEACANVVNHAAGADTIQVRLDVAEDHCAIDVAGLPTGLAGNPGGLSKTEHPLRS